MEHQIEIYKDEKGKKKKSKKEVDNQENEDLMVKNKQLKRELKDVKA